MKISDFCLLNNANLKKKEYFKEYLYLDTANITNGTIDSLKKYSSYEELPSRARRKVTHNSILYSTVRPNQKHFGILTSPPDNLIVSTGFCVIDVDAKIANPRYLYYHLSQDAITFQLQAIAEQATTAYPSIKSNDLGDLEINLPELDRQNTIAKVLTALDNKILLNIKISDNLMQQAEAIYRYLFIKNESTSWRIGYLSELVAIRYGKDHQKLADGSIPVYGSGGVMRFAERSLYEHESVLIPRLGSLHNVIYVNHPFWSVNTMFYTEMKCCNVAKYVYFFLKSQNLVALNAGSAVPRITTEILKSLQVKIPSDSTLLMFESMVAPLFKTISHNNLENKKLQDIRDCLLIKFFS